MSFNPQALKEMIEGSGVPYRQNGNSYIFTCPKCTKASKLWMLKDSGRFVCWYCREIEGYQGKAEWALTDLLGLDLGTIRRRLYGIDLQMDPELGLQFELIDFWGDEDDPPPLEALEEIGWPIDSFPITHPAAHKGAIYLVNRGIPLDVAAVYEIRYWPQRQRVLFPVIMGGRLLGYQGRTIYNAEPKILTSDGLRRDRTLMFYDSIKTKPNHVIVVEGPIDGIKCHLCGPTVVTMGKAVSKEQLQLLRNSGAPRIYIGLDPDATDEIQRLVEELTEFETFVLFPPPGREDLGECSFEEVRQAFEAAPKVTPGNLICDLKLPAFLT